MTLLDRGGFLVVEGMLGRWVDRLAEEARRQFEKATRAIVAGPNQEEWRGGEPARALWTAPANAVQYHVYTSPEMNRAMSRLCGIELEASGGGSYSYYYEPGDFLELHRDIDRCDIATITLLEETGSAKGGGLRVYPGYEQKPLSAVRRDGPQGVDVRINPGQMIVLAGGVVPHEVMPMAEGQRRSVALACYRMIE